MERDIRAADLAHCDDCGGTIRYLQRVSRERPLDYYQCASCGRIWPLDKEQSAHWRRVADPS